MEKKRKCLKLATENVVEQRPFLQTKEQR